MRVFSDTDNLRWTGTEWGGGVGLVLTETGENTCEFTGQLKFATSGTSDDTSGTLLVTEGDILAFYSELTGDFWNGQIIPTSIGKGSIIAHRDVDGYNAYTAEVTASYNEFSIGLDITPGWVPGSGGGGVIVKPGLVLNVIAALFGSGTAIPPTLGLDQQHKRIVDDGFSFNDNPVNVEQYYTPYPLITTEVGKLNTIKLKIYENRGIDNIAHVGLSYGLGKGETFNEGKATIEYDRTFDGTESVTLFDPNDSLGAVNVTSTEIDCSINNNAKCLEVTFDHIFRAPLEFNMVSTNIWDFQRNSWQNYFNHGIHITGESLNPPKTQLVSFGTSDMKGLFTLTQIDIFEDKWIDESGNIYLYKGNNRFDKIQTLPKEAILDSMTKHGCDRLCNWFEKYKANQEHLAKSELDKMLLGKEIAAKQKGFTPAPASDFVSRAEDVELQNRIVEEEKKAQEFLKQYFDKNYPGIKYR